MHERTVRCITTRSAYQSNGFIIFLENGNDLCRTRDASRMKREKHREMEGGDCKEKSHAISAASFVTIRSQACMTREIIITFAPRVRAEFIRSNASSGFSGRATFSLSLKGLLMIRSERFGAE